MRSCENPKRIPNYNHYNSRVRRFTRRGGRPHRVERLRNKTKINTASLQIHCRPFSTQEQTKQRKLFSSFCHAHATCCVGLLSAVQSKKRQRHKRKTNSHHFHLKHCCPFPHVEFIVEFNFFSKILKTSCSFQTQMQNAALHQKRCLLLKTRQNAVVKHHAHPGENVHILNQSKFICGRIICSK